MCIDENIQNHIIKQKTEIGEHIQNHITQLQSNTKRKDNGDVQHASHP